MAQTFKEKLAELESKRQLEQDTVIESESVTPIAELDQIGRATISETDATPPVSETPVPVQKQAKWRINGLTLAIVVSLFVIVLAQVFALGDFSLTHQVSQKSLDQKFTYKGGLKNGRFSGNGIITDASGDTLKATFKAGKITGPVTYTKNNAYVVTQKNDKVTITLADQAVLHLLGGRFTFSDTVFSYDGNWRYAGSWQGKMQFANGASYDGAWQNGLPNGKGTYMPMIGTPITGNFKMGALEE